MKTCPICGKQAQIWQPGDYKICFCTGDCGDFEISAAAESAIRSYDGEKIGRAMLKRRNTGWKPGRLGEADLAALHAEAST
jgi:hypothetical protein